jgi:putative FmdB family regulatory protein
MPIYEYRCSACQHELEAIQKFSDAALVACPQCGKDTLVKLVSAAGFQLKGSGWYQTDFRGSGSKPAAKTDAADGAAKGTDGAKSESAPAATAESAPSKGDAPAASTPATTSTPSPSA